MEIGDIFNIPANCPTCGGPTTEEGDFLYCRTKTCPSQIRGLVYIWVRNLGLLQWGDSLINSLTNPNTGLVKSLSDLYGLTVDEIATCCSGEKVAEKCYQTLHGNKDVPIELMFGSINIQNFARSTASDIVQAGYDTVDKILAMSYEDLLKVPNIGEITARSIFNGLREKESSIRDLEKVVNVKSPTQGNLTGISFCITGELSQPRKLVEKKILEAGGQVKSSVGKTTTYLVTNDTTSGSSKLKNAAKYGTQIIDEPALCKIIGL